MECQFRFPEIKQLHPNVVVYCKNVVKYNSQEPSRRHCIQNNRGRFIPSDITLLLFTQTPPAGAFGAAVSLSNFGAHFGNYFWHFQ